MIASFRKNRRPSGRAMFGMLGVLAELEREMIKERVQVGMNRIKATIARDKKVHHQGRHRP